MSEQFVIHLAREVLLTTFLISAPVLIASMVVGLLVAIFQAATSINEMTLTFVPKLIVMAIVLIIVLPWILDVIITFTQNLINQIPNIAH